VLPRVYEEFERICTQRGVQGAVLEVGAIPSDQSLLCMQALSGATERIGINLDGPHEYRGFRILKGNANCMDCFVDNRFDAVLCNAVLEHDKHFWKAIAEMKRVTRPGGLIAIGAPAYGRLLPERDGRPRRVSRRHPIVRRAFSHGLLFCLSRGTLTVRVHNAPGDYYRFSAQAFREVFFDGMHSVQVRSLMMPPILIGSGLKP
jgi:SAM-dependent methyltransferase